MRPHPSPSLHHPLLSLKVDWLFSEFGLEQPWFFFKSSCFNCKIIENLDKPYSSLKNKKCYLINPFFRVSFYHTSDFNFFNEISKCMTFQLVLLWKTCCFWFTLFNESGHSTGKGLTHFDSLSLFWNQEIDGNALLLLKSDMIMKYLGLKLGPALKLCYHIDKLKQAKF